MWIDWLKQAVLRDERRWFYLKTLVKEVTELGDEEVIFFVSGKVTVEIGIRKKLSNTFKQIVFQDSWKLLTNKNSIRWEQIFLENWPLEVQGSWTETTRNWIIRD